MALTVYEDLEQGSEEWLQARAGIVTASTVGQLITTKTLKTAQNDTARGLVSTLVAERITGHVEEIFPNRDMQRGTLSEPYAREIYEQHYAATSEVGFMVRDDWGFKIGYSPDGLVGDDGLIEIKSPRQKTHLNTLLTDMVPIHYMAQCQTEMLVSGREWVDFISYNSGMPFFVKRVHPDEQWREAIVNAVKGFESDAAALMETYQLRIKGRPQTERIDVFEEEEIRI
ncbi:lambda exonuclease family protein [Citricoccus sp. K5]|uniref:lambda exonuclease family protein n=1 Tax=Citricoccus sp. K5 TaxID=2653135 RepID=UPI0012F1F843|nr:lambda exonuclease family protein [Citricoccus sp. K5]VXB24288.1 conserved hypothetical protein [Citricoccus sp. K5]